MKKIVVETQRGGLHWWRIIVAVVVLVVLAVVFWPASEKLPTVVTQPKVATAPQIGLAQSPCAKPEMVVARLGVWTKIPNKRGCSWAGYNNPAYGQKNFRACVTYRVTYPGGVTLSKNEGVCPAGELWAHFDPDVPIDKLEVRSRSLPNVFIIMNYTSP